MRHHSTVEINPCACTADAPCTACLYGDCGAPLAYNVYVTHARAFSNDQVVQFVETAESDSLSARLVARHGSVAVVRIIA